ncbi:hypothetical protein, partial [Micromonospora sp. NPDC000018]|uniref:hypothetical protein n=1 Tax=Micromonospora sp. NPDC000018 TaxID=3154239 RepID=UPI0033269184
MSVIAVAARPDVRDLFFDADGWAALRGLGELRQPPDGADVGDETVLARLLGDADVVVTGWGTAPLSAAVGAAAPPRGRGPRAGERT